MNRQIVRFETGLTSSGRFTFTLAVLDCGHHVGFLTKPMLGRCMFCRDAPEIELQPMGKPTRCSACGGGAFTITFQPDESKEQDRISKIGDSVPCGDCTANLLAEEWLRALDPTTVHHARYSPRWGGQYHLYRLDRTSPSNFMLIGTVPAIPAIDKLLQEKRISPLSPVEPAY